MNTTISKTNEKLPSVKQYIQEIGILPQEAILFGMCEDGLPYLLNVNDDISPNVAIENGQAVLRTIHQYVTKTRISKKILVDCVYVTDFNEAQIIPALVDWSDKHPRNAKVIVLIDRLENLHYNNEFVWLLRNGAKHGIFIVASYNKQLEILSEFQLNIRKDGEGFVAPEGLYNTVRFFAL